jgi:hypothetical protein
MGFYSNPVSNLELVDRFAQADDNTGILMPGYVYAIGGLAGECLMDQGDVGTAYCAGFDLDEHICWSRFWNGNSLQFHMVWTH